MKKLNAFVIEDHPGQGLVFRTALQQIGFRAELIQNGKLAQDRLHKTAPDFVLLDLHMPGVSGQELLEQMTSDERFADTTIAIASADAELADSLKDQVAMVVIKPVGFDQLQKLVKDIMKMTTKN